MNPQPPPAGGRRSAGGIQRRAAAMARQAVSSLAPPAGRKRAPKLQTCIRCRVGKIKCDGFPCSRCFRLAVPCRFQKSKRQLRQEGGERARGAPVESPGATLVRAVVDRCNPAEMCNQYLDAFEWYRQMGRISRERALAVLRFWRLLSSACQADVTFGIAEHVASALGISHAEIQAAAPAATDNDEAVVPAPAAAALAADAGVAARLFPWEQPEGAARARRTGAGGFGRGLFCSEEECQQARAALKGMRAAALRLGAEDEAFLEFDGQRGGQVSGRVGLGRAFRMVRWAEEGRCLEACNGAYEDHFRAPGHALLDGLRRDALPLLVDAAFVAPEDRPLFFRCCIEAEMGTRGGEPGPAVAVGEGAASLSSSPRKKGAVAGGPPRTFSHFLKFFTTAGEVSLFILTFRQLAPPPPPPKQEGEGPEQPEEEEQGGGGSPGWGYIWVVEPAPLSSHVVPRVRPSGTDTYFSRPVFRYIKGEKEVRGASPNTLPGMERGGEGQGEEEEVEEGEELEPSEEEEEEEEEDGATEGERSSGVTEPGGGPAKGKKRPAKPTDGQGFGSAPAPFFVPFAALPGLPDDLSKDRRSVLLAEVCSKEDGPFSGPLPSKEDALARTANAPPSPMSAAIPAPTWEPAPPPAPLPPPHKQPAQAAATTSPVASAAGQDMAAAILEAARVRAAHMAAAELAGSGHPLFGGLDAVRQQQQLQQQYHHHGHHHLGPPFPPAPAPAGPPLSIYPMPGAAGSGWAPPPAGAGGWAPHPPMMPSQVSVATGSRWYGSGGGGGGSAGFAPAPYVPMPAEAAAMVATTTANAARAALAAGQFPPPPFSLSSVGQMLFDHHNHQGADQPSSTFLPQHQHQQPAPAPGSHAGLVTALLSLRDRVQQQPPPHQQPPPGGGYVGRGPS